MIKIRFTIVILFFFIFSFSCMPVQAIRLDINSFTAQEVWNKIHSNNQPLIIDVRAETLYIEGHIPTSINIVLSSPVDEAMANTISSITKEENILYCSCPEGSNAKIFSEELTDLGLSNLSYMNEDFRDWRYDIVTGSDPGTITNISENINANNNNKKTSSNIEFSDLLPINIFLALIAVIIVIWKKRK